MKGDVLYMLFLWLLFVIVIIVFLKYLYLIIKRFHLLRKIRKQIKKHNGSMQYCRNPMISIFKHDGKMDIFLQVPNKTMDISVITTPLRRVRYHFNIDNKSLELIIERRAVHVGGLKSPRPTHICVIDSVYTVRKYKIGFEASNNNHQKYVILNPAPKSVSKSDGATLTALYNNDDLIPGVKVCGLKWFVENVFDE